MISVIAFIIVAVILCVLTLLAVLGITDVYMSGPEAIERDGMMPGRRAPTWSLRDSSGRVHQSPPVKALQMVVFGDHSLKSFPSVVDGLRELSTLDADLEIVILPRQESTIAEPTLRLLGLGDIPFLTPSESLYAHYNVRVAPFVIVVDSAGLVRGSSLVNYGWQIMKLFQIAGIAPGQVDESPDMQLRTFRAEA